MQSKTLKRTILLACIVLAMVFALTACALFGSEPGGEKQEPDNCTHSWIERNREGGSCTEDEIAYYFCELCKNEKQEVVNKAPGHTIQIEPGRASSCTEDGVSDREYCSACGEEIKAAEFIPAPGHKIVEDPAKEATCTEDGLTSGSHCETCNITVVEQQIIHHQGHKQVIDYGFDATCTEDGLTDGYHCRVCETVITAQTVIEAYGHDEVEGEDGYEATCAEDGLTNGTYCSVCYVPITPQKPIPAPGHVYEYSSRVEATCESDGHTAGRYCTTCNVVFEVEHTLPKTIHSFEEGSCKWCELTATDGLTYELTATEDGYLLTGINGSATEITVPNTYEGKPVVAVKENAFSGNTSIVSITFTGNVTTIGEGAFYGCTALSSVYLSESVTEVEANVFDGCTALNKVECEDYSQIDDWSEECFGSSEIKVVSDYKDGKTPYEIYLEAMSMLEQKDNSYKSTYHNKVSFKDVYGSVKQSSSQTIYTELVGLDMYTSYSPALQLNNYVSMPEFMYKDGVYYIQSVSTSPSYYSGYIKQSVSPDYIRALAADMAASFPAPNEETFKAAEFKRNSDGTFTLTLTLDEQQIEDMCFELLEMLFGAEASNVQEISYFTSCVFKYDFDANRKLVHTYVDADLFVENLWGNMQHGIATIDGDVEYSDVGTLTSLSKNAPTSYRDADSKYCTHPSSYHVTVPGYEATCTENGLTDGVYCSNCQQAVTLSQTIYKTGHSTEQGLCEHCGEFVGRATDLEISYNDDGKTATLIGRGENTDAMLEIPDSIFGVKITKIADGAFEGCTDIKVIIIPDSVKVIGNNAFAGCYSITSVTIPSGITEIGNSAFAGCSALYELNLKNKNDLKSIGAYAFDGCSALEYFTLSGKVESIGEGAFRGCTEMAIYAAPESAPAGWNSAWNPDNLTVTWSYIPATDGLEYSLESEYDSSIRDYVDYYVVVGYEGEETDIIIRGDYLGIPVKKIQSYAFRDNKEITSLTFLSGITVIDDYAFYGCEKLTSVILPDTLKKIGGYAFASTAITEITIGESVTTISERAFSDCTALTKVNYNAINATVVTTGYNNVSNMISPFPYASSNVPTFSVTVGAAVEAIPERLFYKSNIGSISFAEGSVCTTLGAMAFAESALSKITLPNGITTIGANALSVESKEIYTVENGLRYIGSAANPYMIFVGVDDTQITSIVINNATTIIAGSVYGQLVKSITIGENVAYICDSAFSNCTGVTELKYNAKNATLGTDVFASTRGNRIGETDGFKLIVGNKVEKLPDRIFYYARELKSIEFEKGSIITEIGATAFYDCVALNQLVLPDSVVTIGSNAFNGCSYLYSVTLGTGLTTVGSGAFMNSNRIYEVVNNSSIQLQSGYSSPGEYVARNAIVITTGESSFEEINGCLFIHQPAVQNENYSSPERYILISYVGEGGAVVLPDDVHGLGYYIEEGAFRYNDKITSIVISDGVSYIDSQVFYHCEALKTVTIGKNVEYIYGEAFAYCTALESVTIADGNTPLVIYGSAFKGCTALTDFSMPDRVKEIHTDAFASCSKLNCNVYGSLNYLGNDKNPYVAIIGYADASTTSVTVHENTKVIAVSSLINGYYLTEINYNATAANDLPLYSTVFRGSGSNGAGITVTIAKNVKRIPAYLCTCGDGSALNLTSITFESGSACEYIGSNAFSYTKIKTLEIPNTVTEIGIGAFASCTLLTTANIPTGLTTVPQAMYSGCGALTSVVIPDGIKEIGPAAFQNCYTLTVVVIPEGVTTIGRSAFSSCSKMKEIVIPSTVTTIAEFAFYNSAVTTIYYNGKSADWNSISKGNFNDPIYSSKTTKYYSGSWELVNGVPTKK